MTSDRYSALPTELSSRLVVQSLNPPFFPPHIGAEPGWAKRESRMTCMRMLRTNQSKITRSQQEPISHTTLLASICRAMPFSARAQKTAVFFDVDVVVKKQFEMWFIVVCTLTDNEYVSLLVSQTFFLIVS